MSTAEGGAPLQKRARSDPGVVQFKMVYQPVGQASYGGRWKHLILELRSNMTVVCDGGSEHGKWVLADKNHVEVEFHYLGFTNTKKLAFERIPHTDAWIQVHCDPAWQAVMVPYQYDEQ